MRASRPGDCAAQSKARYSVAPASLRPQTDFCDSKKKGSWTPGNTPAHSHIYFGYKPPVPGALLGLASEAAKDRTTLHIPSRLGRVYKRALVVLTSSPHQRVFVCGACMGISLVSLFDPLFKRSRLHCFDICLTWYLWHIKVWCQHLRR